MSEIENYFAQATLFAIFREKCALYCLIDVHYLNFGALQNCIYNLKTINQTLYNWLLKTLI